MAPIDLKSDPAQDESGVDETEESLTPPEKLDPSKPKLGPLLDETDEKKVVKAVHKIRERQQKSRQKRAAVWKRNSLWRKGHRHVNLNRAEDKWEATVPLGMANAPPLPNKCDRLARRMTNTLLSDDPVPEAEPSSDSPDDRDAAEHSTRALKIEGGEAGFNLVGVTKRASDKASTYASTFVYWRVDPTGGGRTPKSVTAHPKAVKFENPDQVTLDPETGQGVPKEQYVERFVAPDGTLTENELEADFTWLPTIVPELTTGHNVLFLPEKVDGIANAKGVHLLRPTTLGELKDSYPEAFKKLTPDDIKKIVNWRPEGWKDALPEYVEIQDLLNDEGEPEDESICFIECVYYVSHGLYPKGAYVCVSEFELLFRNTWSFEVDGPKGKTLELMMLPLSQLRQLDDNDTDDPYGGAICERLGPMDEIRAQVYLYAIEHLHRFGNPHTFLPDGSIVQPKQLRRRNGEPIYFNPNGKPEMEKVDEFPSVGDLLREEMTQEENDESSLQQAAQGVEDPSVESGIHARTIVEEAQKGLAQIRTNLGDFYTRSCRICLQLFRVFYTAERQMKWESEDGSYKEEAWTGADLRSTRDVKIARGSFTMMGTSAKRQMALDEIATGVISPQEYQQLMSSSLSPLLGLQDNPFRQKVRRELAIWRKGPTPEFLKLAEEYKKFQAVQTQATQVAGAIGADPAAAAMQPPAPLPSPFQRVPCDTEPAVAEIRHFEISREMASKKFARFPLEWQMTLVQEYQQMYMVQQAVAAAQAAQAPQKSGVTPKKDSRPASVGQEQNAPAKSAA